MILNQQCFLRVNANVINVRTMSTQCLSWIPCKYTSCLKGLVRMHFLKMLLVIYSFDTFITMHTPTIHFQNKIIRVIKGLHTCYWWKNVVKWKYVLIKNSTEFACGYHLICRPAGVSIRSHYFYEVVRYSVEKNK